MPKDFTSELYQTFDKKWKMMPTIHHVFQKTEEEEYLLACILRVV